TPSLNHSSTANSSSEYNSKDFSAALLKPSVRKYLSLSSDAFPISSLKVPDACLLDKSICNIRLCACTVPCAVYESCNDSASLGGAPSSSVITVTSCATGIAISPSTCGIDFLIYP